jgi:hypothetical protein
MTLLGVLFMRNVDARKASSQNLRACEHELEETNLLPQYACVFFQLTHFVDEHGDTRHGERCHSW